MKEKGREAAGSGEMPFIYADACSGVMCGCKAAAVCSTITRRRETKRVKTMKRQGSR
jgi:hypothetical protein